MIRLNLKALSSAAFASPLFFNNKVAETKTIPTLGIRRHFRNTKRNCPPTAQNPQFIFDSTGSSKCRSESRFVSTLRHGFAVFLLCTTIVSIEPQLSAAFNDSPARRRLSTLCSFRLRSFSRSRRCRSCAFVASVEFVESLLFVLALVFFDFSGLSDDRATFFDLFSFLAFFSPS